MAEGRVVAWTPQKGLGIVVGDDGLEAFVHHAQIATPGFKDLLEGQRVRYEVRSDPRGNEAVGVVPLDLFEVELSPDEWKMLKGEPSFKVTTKPAVDPWKRPLVIVVVELAAREALNDRIRFIQGELKEEQPEEPVWVVDFDFDEGAGSGWCAVNEPDQEKAEALVKAKIREYIPEGAVPGEITNSMPLMVYEQETGRTLRRDCFPKRGEVVPLGIDG